MVVIPQARCRTEAFSWYVNGHARKRPVTTGGTSGKGVLVESGLIGGEDLIVSPPANLKDGQGRSEAVRRERMR